MIEYQMTGYLSGMFSHDTGKGKVLNFKIISSGYMDKAQQRYKSHEYYFETWLPDLIEKIENIPRGTVLTVHFNIIPRNQVISGKNINRNILKANQVINWNNQKKIEVGKHNEELKDENQIMWSFEGYNNQ